MENFLAEVKEKYPDTFREFDDWYDIFFLNNAANIKYRMPPMLGKDNVYTSPEFHDLPYEFQYAVLLSFFNYKNRLLLIDQDQASVFFMKLFSYVENNVDESEREPVSSEGAMMIYRERMEQIQKHGHTVDDDKANDNQELIRAAAAILMRNDEMYPSWWDRQFYFKTINRPDVEGWAIAGALIAAQIDSYNEEKKLNDGIQNGD